MLIFHYLKYCFIFFHSIPTDYSKIFYFHVVLPNNLPPSHEVPFGHTRYKIEAYYNTQTVFKYFSVNQWVDLEKRNDTVVCVIIFNLCPFAAHL